MTELVIAKDISPTEEHPIELKTSFKVTSIHPNNDFGAEVSGLNLAQLTNEEIKLINNYLLQYKILVFKDQQNLTVEEQREFSKRFGVLHSHIEATSHHPDYPDVNIISNISNTRKITTGGHNEEYHSDLSWFLLKYLNTILFM
jgi:taurine dioxygenase